MTDVDQDYGDDDVNLIEDAPTAADAPDDAGDDAQGDPAPTAVSVLDLLVTSLVDDPDAVRIDPMEQRGRVRLEVRVGPDDLQDLLGDERFLPEEARRELLSGVATGLAWTESGGEVAGLPFTPDRVTPLRSLRACAWTRRTWRVVTPLVLAGMSMGVTRAISSHVTLLGYKELTRPALTKLVGGRGWGS